MALSIYYDDYYYHLLLGILLLRLLLLPKNERNSWISSLKIKALSMLYCSLWASMFCFVSCEFNKHSFLIWSTYCNFFIFKKKIEGTPIPKLAMMVKQSKVYTMRRNLPKLSSVLIFWKNLLNFSLKNISQTVKKMIFVFVLVNIY